MCLFTDGKDIYIYDAQEKMDYFFIQNFVHICAKKVFIFI